VIFRRAKHATIGVAQLLGLSIVGLLGAAQLRAAEPREAVEFNRDVRPILADHCFQCHGPDAKQRKADLRLDTPEAADPKREGGPIVVGGQPEKSELWRRINSTDGDERMPPPAKGDKLTAAEIATLKQWILEGGKFAKHWSLLPVRRPDLPLRMAGGERSSTPADRRLASLDPSHSAPGAEHAEVRMQNGIDAFVVAKLVGSGLMQSPEADRATLLRRVALALTGVPATPEEIGTFLSDRSPDAMSASSIACWPRRAMANEWPSPGSTRRGMPTRAAIKATASGSCGGGAIG